MQRQILNSDRRLTGNFASRIGALLAMTGLLMLSACDGRGNTVTENNLADDFGKDGAPPVLTEVTIRESTKTAKPGGFVKLGKSVRVDIVASESIMAPVVTIMGVEATVDGNANSWNAIRQITEDDALGEVTFTITYQDISGEAGLFVSSTTDGSSVVYCDDETIKCPAPVNLAGDWRLDGDGAAGIGPEPGNIEWWASTAANGAGPVERACWFDDVFRLGADGSFQNVLGDETWLEPWQGVDEGCGAPIAPHDGSTTGAWVYDEAASTLTITGVGSYLGLSKAVNGAELASPAAAPDSIVYQVLTLDGDSLVVSLETKPNEYWTFRLARQPVSPLAGKWKLDGDGAAGIGPEPGNVEWWASTAANGAGPVERACWFDDVYEFNADGSFRNIQGSETWLEPWQGVDEGCGAPIAPHDGSNGAIFQYDEDASTLKLTGKGAYLGLGKAVNGTELTSPAGAPESITYQVLTLDGDSMTVSLETKPNEYWTFRLTRVSNSPLIGNWKLDGDGAAGIGPEPGNTEWWASTAANGAGPVERACWFDDVFHFGADGSYRNFQGADTWLEPWQGVDEGCGAPIAPHDGSNDAIFEYDADAGTLTITGTGAYVGLSKAVNGTELASPAAAPESITYQVLTLDGDSMTVSLETKPNEYWTFRLARVTSAPLTGKWRLDGDGAAGIGPEPGNVEWWASTAANGAGPVERACWFDDVFDFGGDGSFQNFQGADTWLEPWQGVDEGCGAPIAPHDGSNDAIFEYDEDASTLTVTGKGAYVGLSKAVNGTELASPAAAPESITYQVLTLDGDSMTVSLETKPNEYWTFRLARVSNSPLVGNWKLDGDGAAGIGPEPGNVEWWASTAANGAGPEERACWFDDVFHFGAGGTFQNFQDGDTWLEPWQGVAEGCGPPIAPHDGSSTGSFFYDDAAESLTIRGRGSYIGLSKAVNGSELGTPASAPDSIDYTVLALDVGILTVTLETKPNEYWTLRLAKE